jgi:hypothetical protein
VNASVCARRKVVVEERKRTRVGTMMPEQRGRGGKKRSGLGTGDDEAAAARIKPYGRSYSDEDDPLYDFCLYDAWDLGTLSMNGAAERLGVSISVLKFRCRALGVARWPGRRLQGIASCYEYVASLVSVR